jgi:hypothetical protein
MRGAAGVRRNVAAAVRPERQVFGLDPKEALKVVPEEALTGTLMGTVAGLPITKLEEVLTGHRKVSLEGSPIVGLTVGLKVDLKVGLTGALKVGLTVDLSVDPT